MKTLKGSHKTRFWTLFSIAAVVCLVAAMSLTILFPSAAISQMTVASLKNLPEHTYQFVEGNINMANITNNYTDFTSNIVYADGFGFVMNHPSDNAYKCGIYYDGRGYAMGDYNLPGEIKVNIPYGAMSRELSPSVDPTNIQPGDDTTGLYDVRVTFSNITLGMEEASIVTSKPSDWGRRNSNGRFDTDSTDFTTGWMSTDLFNFFTDNSSSTKAVAGSKGSGRSSLWLQAMKSADNDYHQGWQCDVTVEIIRHTSNWKTASTVTGTIPMAYDDIDMPDYVTPNRARADMRSNPNNSDAAACWNAIQTRTTDLTRDNPGWSTSDVNRMARMGQPTDSFGDYDLWNGAYKEKITIKSGCQQQGSSNLVYFHTDSTLITINNTILTNGVSPAAQSGFTDAAFVFFADATGSTVRWSGGHCGTKLFSTTGTYSLTIKRIDNYGTAAGTIRNGKTVSGKYTGSITVFPNDNGYLDATVNSGYYVKQVKVDGVNKSVDELRWDFNAIQADHVVEVELAPYYKITTSVEYGSISRDVTNLKEGDNAKITYEPDPGCRLEKILIDGVEVDDPYEFLNSYDFNNIDRDHTIHVVYAPMASLQIESESNAPNITDENKLYDFEGLTYEIRDKDGNTVATVKAKKDGSAVTVENLSPGEYTIWSIDDNGCYQEAVNVGRVTLTAGSTGTVTMYHPPVNDPITIIVDKDWA